MTLANWLWLAFSLVATLVFTVIVWIGGPLVIIGDSQPFGGLYTRLLIILVVWTICSRSSGGRCGSAGAPRRSCARR